MSKDGCPIDGRPFVKGDAAVIAAAVASNARWTALQSRGGCADLSGAERDALAATWTRRALLEHASIGSFARFALELMAVGAPAALVADAHRAAVDEVRHAELCFAIARRFGESEVGPSSFPFDGSVRVDSDLARVAAATVREGCVNETLAALLAAEQYASSSDAGVREALLEIAEDEARHAELAWRTCARAGALAAAARARDT